MKTFKKNGFFKLNLKDKKIINKVNEIINFEFGANENISNTAKFRDKLLKCADVINRKLIHIEFLKNNKKFFEKLLNVNDIVKDCSVTTTVYLRGVRPKKSKKVEYLGFHRENFYNDFDYINKQINIHIPIKNYNLKTSMKYFPLSHKIPDKKLETYKKNSQESGVKKFSKSHRLGLVYNPKVITKGVNFDDAVRVKLKNNQAFVFNARLLHGGGENKSRKVRFSLDFAIILNKHLQNNKSYHFASYHKSKKHFVSLKEYI